MATKLTVGNFCSYTHAAPHAALWRHVKDEHVKKDAAQDGSVKVLGFLIVIFRCHSAAWFF